jgi:1,2-phenylacetyl-CoA epoxidase catalytic subunit
MESNMTTTTTPDATNIALHRLFWLGLKVLGSELTWLFLLTLRNWEIAQLRKRLRQEYHALGMIEAAEAGLELAKNDQELNIFDEKELAIKQIAFLLDEIEYLKARLKEERAEYVQRRVQKWKLPSGSSTTSTTS